MARETKIPPVLDRWSIPQLAMPKFLFDVPTGATVVGWVEEHSLQRRDRSINNPFALARYASQRVLGGAAKGCPHIRRKGAGQSGNYELRIDVVGNRHGRASGLRND
jgi:hypothetical protein